MEFLNKISKDFVTCGPSAVAHIHNPSYSGSRDVEGLWFVVCPGKMLVRPHLNQKAECAWL
jgi:hypothetical protein